MHLILIERSVHIHNFHTVLLMHYSTFPEHIACRTNRYLSILLSIDYSAIHVHVAVIHVHVTDDR